MPRCTGTFSLGISSPSFSVLFWPEKIASERSLPTFSESMSKAAENSMSRDVVAAQVDVHQAGYGLRRVGVLVVVHALHERARAVADADDRHPDLLSLVSGAAAIAVRRSRCGAHFEVFPFSKIQAPASVAQARAGRTDR